VKLLHDKVDSKIWYAPCMYRSNGTRSDARADMIVDRVGASLSITPQNSIKSDFTYLSLLSKNLMICFMPDEIVFKNGYKYFSCKYESFFILVEEVLFIEPGYVPSAEISESVIWLFSCNDGTRDLRFKNNRKVPIIKYGMLTFSYLELFDITLFVSSFGVAQDIRAIFEDYKSRFCEVQ